MLGTGLVSVAVPLLDREFLWSPAAGDISVASFELVRLRDDLTVANNDSTCADGEVLHWQCEEA